MGTSLSSPRATPRLSRCGCKISTIPRIFPQSNVTSCSLRPDTSRSSRWTSLAVLLSVSRTGKWPCRWLVCTRTNYWPDASIARLTVSCSKRFLPKMICRLSSSDSTKCSMRSTTTGIRSLTKQRAEHIFRFCLSAPIWFLGSKCTLLKAAVIWKWMPEKSRI